MIAYRSAATAQGALCAPPVHPAIRPTIHRPDESAGELSYAPALSFPRHVTVQQLIEALRTMRPAEESVAALFVTGDDGRLIGVVGLPQLVTAPPEARLESLMATELVTLPAELSAEEQARMLSSSGQPALPVVDASGRLVGSLGAGELLSAVEEEATAEIYRLAGVAENEELARPLRHAARDRIFWLMINMATAFTAAAVVSRFEGVIAEAAVLAAFMPVVAGQGGNAGTQTLTFIVRSLALGQVGFNNARATLLREFAIGVCNGLAIGTLVGLIAWLWQGSWALGAVIAIAMLGNLILAALAGVLVPLTLKALRIDPALASSIFVTAVTDVCGFLLFLGLGGVALSMGYL